MPDKNLTISFSIKEKELEPETARLYEKALTKLECIADELPENTDKTLSFQTLENVQCIREQLAECDQLFSNVENIVIQYLEHKSRSMFELRQENIPDASEQNDTLTEQEVIEQVSNNLNSQYAKQRMLAKELAKNENPS